MSTQSALRSSLVSPEPTFRRLVRPIKKVEQIDCPTLFAKRRASNSLARAGLQYEKLAYRALSKTILRLQHTIVKLEYQPWIRFIDQAGTNLCCPDFILSINDGLVVLVIDAKLSWNPLADEKMSQLYVPLVNHLLEPVVIRSVLLVKHLPPDSPKPISNLFIDSSGSIFSPAVYHWTGQGPILW